MVEQQSCTVAQVLGEITWLMSQSKDHKSLTIADLEWAIMPAVLLNQFHIFYEGKQPVAAALWAKLSEAAESQVLASAAAGKMIRLDARDWRSGERLWVIEIICPAATPENKLLETIFEKLQSGPFKDQGMRYVRLTKKDPQGGNLAA